MRLEPSDRVAERVRIFIATRHAEGSSVTLRYVTNNDILTQSHVFHYMLHVYNERRVCAERDSKLLDLWQHKYIKDSLDFYRS